VKKRKKSLRVYVSSKSRHHALWRAVRAAGVDIRADWIDAEFNISGREPSPAEWSEHWAKCIEQARKADVVLLFAQSDENQRGSLVELGAGIAGGAEILCVSPHPWSFKHHPKVRNFASLEEAIAVLTSTSSA
jgi:hypothetical protein